MIKHLLEVIGSTLIVVFGSWMLFTTFIPILRHGIVAFNEPSMPILIGEIVFCILIIVFGAYHIINDLVNFAKSKIGQIKEGGEKMERKNKWLSRKFIAAVVAFVFTITATAGFDMPISEVAAVDGILMFWIAIEGALDMFKK